MHEILVKSDTWLISSVCNSSSPRRVTDNRSRRTAGYFVAATLLIKVGSNLTFWFTCQNLDIEFPNLTYDSHIFSKEQSFALWKPIVCLFSDVYSTFKIFLFVIGGSCCCSKMKGNFKHSLLARYSLATIWYSNLSYVFCDSNFLSIIVLHT